MKNAYQILVAVLALLGSVLGICNSIHALRAARPRLRVSLRRGFVGRVRVVTVRVCNVGAVPVTVDRVGAYLAKPRELVYFNGDPYGALLHLPQLLGPGAILDALIPVDAVKGDVLPRLRRAFCETSDGAVVKGERERNAAAYRAAAGKP